MHDGHRTCANPYTQPNIRSNNNGDSFGYRFRSNRNPDSHSDRWAELNAYRDPDSYTHANPYRNSRVGWIVSIWPRTQVFIPGQ